MDKHLEKLLVDFPKEEAQAFVAKNEDMLQKNTCRKKKVELVVGDIKTRDKMQDKPKLFSEKKPNLKPPPQGLKYIFLGRNKDQPMMISYLFHADQGMKYLNILKVL